MNLLHIWHGWFLPFFLFCAALVFSNAFHWVLFKFVGKKQQEGKQSFMLGLGLKQYLGKPARVIFLLTCCFIAQPFIPVSAELHTIIRRALSLIMVISLGWFATGVVYVIQGVLYRRYDISIENNVDARRFRTQFGILRHTVITFIVVITIAACAYTFHDERLMRAGTGLLASAGLASLVLAGAAKSTVGNFLAGVQIALTQPIRIDDAVIVQGEFGNIEEITSAYVVIRLWDLRRMIVPLSFFIENPFQNWTRQSADIMGSAFLYLDYSVPVQPLREQLEKICASSKLWDGKVANLQVTNLKESTMEIRCLTSARNSGQSSDLSSFVREQMIAFVRDNYPDGLPKTRQISTNIETQPSDVRPAA